MSEKVPLALRAARMSVLGHALADRTAEFPLVLEFPGDATHASAERTFAGRDEIERTLTDAQVNAVNDGLAIYTLPDGGFLLADKAVADPWREATSGGRRPFVDARRNWLGPRW